MFTDLFSNPESHSVAKALLANTLKTKRELQEVINNIRQENKTICWTNGVFDMLHLGHMLFLQDVATKADIMIVGINSDISVAKHKPEKDGIKRPLMNEQLRALSLASIKGVDYVFIFDNPSTEEYIEIIKPDIWCRGGSYKKEYGIAMEEHPEGKLVIKHGGKCLVLPMVGGYSTTELIKRIKNA